MPARPFCLHHRLSVVAGVGQVAPPARSARRRPAGHQQHPGGWTPGHRAKQRPPIGNVLYLWVAGTSVRRCGTPTAEDVVERDPKADQVRFPLGDSGQ